MAKNILEIKNLTFSFHTYGGVVKSVRDVSFNVREGEILGIVGESGCGKSVTSQCILKLNPEPPGFFEGGSIKYKGEEIITKTDREMRKIRGVEDLSSGSDDLVKPDHDGWKTDRGGFCRTEGDDPGRSQGTGAGDPASGRY